MPLACLFVDLNSYFASVEQQLRPELRGRPVGVVPMMTDRTCCLAASYEAKRFGVRTGINVGEARRLCPGMTFVQSRPEVYIDFHHRILKAAETCLPIHSINSIDEFCCRLGRGQREPEQAAALARQVKQAIREQVGECMGCSIGIAPNRFLAKVGTDMQKPDGLVIIQEHELPDRLFELDLLDLPGIGPRMTQHLNKKGINSVRQLCALSMMQMQQVWESIVGQVWWHWLRGHDLADQPTTRRSIGHQHVLSPEFRNDADARAVTVRLLHKAAARARQLGYGAGRLSLVIKQRGQPSWSDWIPLRDGCMDTLSMIEALDRLWARRLPGPPMFVGVTLSDLVPASTATIPLFPQEQRRIALARAIDALDRKFGRYTVCTAAMHHVRKTRAGGIAFHSIPDLSLPDAV